MEISQHGITSNYTFHYQMFIHTYTHIHTCIQTYVYSHQLARIKFIFIYIYICTHSYRWGQRAGAGWVGDAKGSHERNHSAPQPAMPEPPKKCAYNGCTADAEQMFSPLAYSSVKGAWTCVCRPKKKGTSHTLDYFQGRWQRESQRQASLRVSDVPAVQEARPTVATEMPRSAYVKQNAMLQLANALSDVKACYV